jgi:biopolymer transport protein ExbD
MPKVNGGSEAPSPGRHGRGRRVSTSLSEINVVPMVDVMLVLLIIFMVAAPMIQRGVDVNLPVNRNAQQMTGDRIEITVPLAYRQDKVVFIGREQVRAAVLQERMRQKMETAAKKEVFLGGDRGVNLGELMEVFSMLKAAGVERVGIETTIARER